MVIRSPIQSQDTVQPHRSPGPVPWHTHRWEARGAAAGTAARSPADKPINTRPVTDQARPPCGAHPAQSERFHAANTVLLSFLHFVS